jgi:hypothetical protein
LDAAEEGWVQLALANGSCVQTGSCPILALILRLFYFKVQTPPFLESHSTTQSLRQGITLGTVPSFAWTSSAGTACIAFAPFGHCRLGCSASQAAGRIHRALGAFVAPGPLQGLLHCRLSPFLLLQF